MSEISIFSNNALPISYNSATGLQVYKSYTSASGLNYIAGVREIEGLMIVESVAQGVGCSFLCGIHIYNKESKQLMAEISVPRNVHYTRDKAMKLVKSKLLKILLDSVETEGGEINEMEAIFLIDSMLDKSYFGKSRAATMDWARSVGIIKKTIV